MIRIVKYASIKGFKNLGEIHHHLYQWIEKDVDEPSIILLRAYDTSPKIWLGKLFNGSNTYINLDPSILDLKEVNDALGDVELVKDLKVLDIYQVNHFEEVE